MVKTNAVHQLYKSEETIYKEKNIQKKIYINLHNSS